MCALRKTTDSYLSANGADAITYYIYRPAGEPTAVVQISHGMCEYLTRYEPFIEYLTDRGYLVCGNDHLGHGASKGKALGYFGGRKGYDYLPRDLYQLTLLMKEAYPDIPYFLLGHSMGSFIAREYLYRHGDLLSGAVISGTSGRQPAYLVGIPLSGLIECLRGKIHRSVFLDRLAFGSYNKRFGGSYGDSYWLTKDQSLVDAYRGDPHCNFIFTAEGMNTLFHLIGRCNRRNRFTSLPKDLSLLFVSGDMDPVGQYGKGVRQAAGRMRKAGLRDVTCKLYPGNRHECINEENRQEVWADILAWLEKRL